MLEVISPMSGANAYTYDKDFDTWKSTGRQTHFMESLLVREFMLVSNGYLSF